MLERTQVLLVNTTSKTTLESVDKFVSILINLSFSMRVIKMTKVEIVGSNCVENETFKQTSMRQIWYVTRCFFLVRAGGVLLGCFF